MPVTEKPQKKKRPRLLLYLVLVALSTSLAATGTMAKFHSKLGIDLAVQAAGFAGGGTVNFDAAFDNMTPGGRKDMEFTVQNYEGEQNSEVQLEYEIQVETTGNLPLVFELSGRKDSGDNSSNSVLVGSLDQNLKAVGGMLPPVEEGGVNRTQHTYTLSVSWKEDETDGDYSHEIDMVSVTVTTKQSNPSAG